MTHMGSQPAFQALGGRQAAVQRHHTLTAQMGKALFKPGLQLRGEVDLRHHHQHLGAGVLRQHPGGQTQINLCLAAAGRAKQQGRPFFGAAFYIKLGQGRLLLCAQRWQVTRVLCMAGV